MSFRLLIIGHSPHADGGLVAAKCRARGAIIDVRRLPEGDGLPRADGAFDAVVVLGGPMSANDDDVDHVRHELAFIERLLARDFPLLGICLGAQMMARVLGSRVSEHPDGVVEVGYYPVRRANGKVREFADSMHFYQWHREGFEQPDATDLLAVGEIFDCQAFRFGGRSVAVQFHPEMTPDTMERWLAGDPPRLKAPGARPPWAHRLGRDSFDVRIDTWLDDFLDDWLPELTSNAKVGS